MEHIKRINKKNFALLARENKTNKTYKVIKINFDSEKVLCYNSIEQRKFSFSEIRLLGFTRKLDFEGKKIFEGAKVKATFENNLEFVGLVINKYGEWIIKDYRLNKFIKLINKDILKLEIF